MDRSHKDSLLIDESFDAIRISAGCAQDYLHSLSERRVSPSQEALDALAGFDEKLPLRPSSVTDVLTMLHMLGSPATTATAAGRFFGLVVGGTLPATLGARILSSAWDQIVFNDVLSPVGVKLEQVASKWLLDILALPLQCSVGFTTGATAANFTCLAGARHTLLERQGWNVEKQGMSGSPPLRIVASEQIHVTVIKALTLLGIGTDNIEYIPCNTQGQIVPERLPHVNDRTVILLQAGNVNSGASDPIADIAAQTAGTGAWIHVDGAFGLWAAASPNVRKQLTGYDAADSWVVDGHKWLNTPYDCGIAISRTAGGVHSAMTTQAPYLKAGGTVAPKDMVLEFSRSARGVEVWAALKSLGRRGVASLVDRCCEHARSFELGLTKLGFEILNDVVLNQVVATFQGAEHRMSELAEAVQMSGDAWFGPTKWRDRQAIRISISSWITKPEDVERALEAIERELKKLNL